MTSSSSAATPEDADTHRAVHLVAAEGDEVGAQRRDVDREVRHRLARVDDDERADRVRPLGELGDGVDGAEHVGDVREGEDLGALGEQRRRGRTGRGRRPAPTGTQRRVAPVRRASSCQGTRLAWCSISVTRISSPGREHEPLVLGVVGRGRVGEGVRDEVERLGGVLREDDLVGGRADERRDGRAGGLEVVGRLLGELVRAAVDGGVVLLVEGALGVEDRRRLVRRRPRVEVDERPAVAHRARQDREVAADRGELPVREGQDVGHSAQASTATAGVADAAVR